jgi:hypothetical protein
LVDTTQVPAITVFQHFRLLLERLLLWRQ